MRPSTYREERRRMKSGTAGLVQYIALAICILQAACGGGGDSGTAAAQYACCIGGCPSTTIVPPVSFSALSTPMLCATTTEDQVLILGDYTISTDAWGVFGNDTKASFVDCVQGSIIGASVQTGVAVHFTWDFGSRTGPIWSSGNGVKAYPEISYTPAGKPLTPIAFADLGQVTMQHDVTASATGDYNIAYDLFADAQPAIKSAKWPHDAEIMIKFSETWCTGPVIDTVTIGGNEYHVTVNIDNWKYIVFSSTKQLLKSSIRLKDFTDYLVAKGQLPSVYYLSSIEFGSEVVDGAGSVAINSFSVTQ